MWNTIDILSEKIQKQKKKIITMNDLKNLVYTHLWENIPDSKIYKLTYQLKNRWFIYPLRKELFYIPSQKSPITPEEIEEKRYRRIIKQHCNMSCNQRYIWWLTALEINLHWSWVTIPESITIMNKEKQAIETAIFEKTIIFKKYEIRWKNLFPILFKQTANIDLPNASKLAVANLELSILECLYNFDTTNKWYIEECIKKAIKKNWKTLNIQNIESLIKSWKHNTSLNRLYDITKTTYPKLSEDIKNLIKKYWFILN